MYRKLLASTRARSGCYPRRLRSGNGPGRPGHAPADPAMEAPAEPETPQEPLVSAADTGINADGWLATEIIGETIYNSTGDDAEAIGDVNDFVLDQNGEIGAVVVGVGGFLGIGQKSVAINWADLELAQDMDGNNRLIANMTREQLEKCCRVRSSGMAGQRGRDSRRNGRWGWRCNGSRSCWRRNGTRRPGRGRDRA